MTVPTTQENQAAVADSNATETNLVKQRKYYEKLLEEERASRKSVEERLSMLEKQAPRSESNMDDEDENSVSEPYVDHRTLKKELKKTIPQLKEEAKKELREEMKKEFERDRINAYLKANPDFETIMQPEMVQKFVDKHPQLAEGILSMPDGFHRQKLVYENIKALGVHKKEEPRAPIQETIDKNRRSPYYVPSGVGSAPHNFGGDFSDAGKKNGYAKMMEMKSRLGLG